MCEGGSWVHPCCHFTTSQLRGLNLPLWWTSTGPLNCRFNPLMTFTFISSHIVSPAHPLQRQSLWFIVGFLIRTDQWVNVGFPLIFICFHRPVTPPMFPTMLTWLMACLQRALDISITSPLYWSNTSVASVMPLCWQSENVASPNPIMLCAYVKQLQLIGASSFLLELTFSFQDFDAGNRSTYNLCRSRKHAHLLMMNRRERFDEACWGTDKI